MPPRRDVDLGLRPGVFRPSTSPVDRTERIGPSPLRELAAALQGGSAVLSRFAGQKADQEQAQDTARAEADVARWATQDNKRYTDMIREGLINPGQSPWYQHAAREAVGRLEATRFGTTLLGQVDQAVQSARGNITFESFLRERLQGFLPEQMDPAYQQGFFRNIQPQIYNARQRFAAKQSEAVEAASVETLQAEMLEAAQSAVLSNPDSLEAITMNLQAIGRRHLVVNPDGGSAVNQAMVTAIGSLARDQEDPTLARTLMDAIVLPNGTKLSSQTLARTELERAQADIYRSGQLRDQARERQIATEVEETYGTLIEQHARGEEINWDSVRVKLRTSSTAFNALRERFARATDTVDDDTLVEQYTAGILRNDGSVTPAVLARAVGTSLSPRTALSLLGQMRANDRFFNEMPTRWKSALTSGATSARRIAAERVGGLLSLQSGTDIRKANQLELQFRQEFLEFYSTHRNTPEADVQAWVNTRLKSYRERNQIDTPTTPVPPPLSTEQVRDLVNELTVDLQDNALGADMDSRLARYGIPSSARRDPSQVRALLSPPASPTPSRP